MIQVDLLPAADLDSARIAISAISRGSTIADAYPEAASSLQDSTAHLKMFRAHIALMLSACRETPLDIRTRTCLSSYAGGGSLDEVYGREWCFDPAVEVRRHLAELLDALPQQNGTVHLAVLHLDRDDEEIIGIFASRAGAVDASMLRFCRLTDPYHADHDNRKAVDHCRSVLETTGILTSADARKLMEPEQCLRIIALQTV